MQAHPRRRVHSAGEHATLADAADDGRPALPGGDVHVAARHAALSGKRLSTAGSHPRGEKPARKP